jgi:hypothetical protein
MQLSCINIIRSSIIFPLEEEGLIKCYARETGVLKFVFLEIETHLMVIPSVLESLSEKGVEIVNPVSEAPGGWSADFKDPDGHPLAFYQLGSLPLK